MKTVVITGGAKGIGAACVRAFAEAGYNLLINYRSSESAANALAAEVREKFHICAYPFRADVSDEKQVREMLAFTKKELGTADVLINNAGISQIKLFSDISADDFNAMLNVNVGGAFHCTKAFLPDMISRKSGSIINISSMWGQVGASCEVHYSTAKAALIGFTKALAKEVGPSGIRVNCIAPGVIDTDMNAELSQADLASLAEETPLMRIGSPQEVAAAALFLAGKGASFITGQVLGVSGGLIV